MRRRMKRKNVNKLKKWTNGTTKTAKKWANGNGHNAFGKSIKKAYKTSVGGVKKHPYIFSISLGSLTLGAGLVTTLMLLRKH